MLDVHAALDRVARAQRAFAVDAATARGWRRYSAAFLAGAVSVAALAPLGVPFVLFFTLPTLVWLLDGAAAPGATIRDTLRKSALLGWLFGFGYFLGSLYWVGYAFFVDAETFGWLAPLAIVGLPAGLALFPAAAAAAARLFWPAGYRRIISLAVAWTVAEWLRGHILTGFPWNMVGDALAASDATLQAAALVGAYGLTFLAVLIFAAPAAIDGRNGAAGRAGWRGIGAGVIALTLLWVGGTVRLGFAETGTVEGVSLRLVQPNIAQKDKWQPENRVAILGQYLRLSARGSDTSPGALDGVTHLIWPESALPFLMAREPLVLSAISRMLPAGVTLIAGAQRAEPDPAIPDGRLRRFYNSLYLIDDKGEIFATYDKAHLTPFGEYLPFQNLLESIGLEQLTRLKGGFEAGAGPMSLAMPGAPLMTPLICYEIIFPRTIGTLEERPGWIVNVTNDAWFGDSPGPPQHFLHARVRAVEQGLPVVRSAGTGISGVIDAHGRVRASLGLNREGVIDARLPIALDPTLYAQYGDLSLAVLLAAAILFAAAPSAFRRSRRETGSAGHPPAA